MEIESLLPKWSLSDPWMVWKCFANYHSVVFLTQTIEYKASKIFLARGKVKVRKFCEEQLFEKLTKTFLCYLLIYLACLLRSLSLTFLNTCHSTTLFKNTGLVLCTYLLFAWYNEYCSTVIRI